MDEIKRYVLVQQAKLLHTDLHYVRQGEVKCLWKHMKNSPVMENEALRGGLMKASGGRKEPVIYQDENQVLFSCIHDDDQDAFLLLGPMALKKLDMAELHQYCSTYGMKMDGTQAPVIFTLTEVLSVTGLANAVVTGQMISEEALLRANHLTVQPDRGMEEEFLRFDLQTEEEGRYHHSYSEEKKLLDCVREGRVEDALRMNMSLDIDTGRLSDDDMRHWQHLVIVAITLCTRAAIEGGLSPAEAYKASDYYIRKSETCREVSALVAWRNKAVRDLTERVSRISSARHSSNHVENAKNYVAAHYREKVYLEDIAGKLGISPTYLSKLFVRETGERLQDYIVRFRVDRAANLLMYSEESIAHIAEYVCFPSQSYMGNVFKKYKGMTPRQYREKHKPREFETRDSIC